tara:strand:- start:64 stop:243 length:180 start_codon:yes stop_codon:yes gene_type:complete
MKYIQDEAIEINPSYFQAYQNRGISKAFTEDFKGACKDWEQVKKLGSNDASELLKEYCR